MIKQILIVILILGSMIPMSMSAQSKKADRSVSKSKTLLVDVRTPAEFAEGSAPGAINIPLDQVASQLDKFKTGSDIVVFCRSGNRSAQAKSILEQNGIKGVTNGGTWQDVKLKYSK